MSNRPSNRKGRSRPPRVAAVDANQREIELALKQSGFSVTFLSQGGGVPDLLVGGMCRETNRRRNWLMEVKSGRGKLNALQVDWHANWRGDVCVVRSVEDALRVVGAYAGLRG